jgi:K+-transporting ATPase ATPase C chain
MRRDIITSVIAFVVLTVVLGVAYPLAVTGVSQLAMPGKANGSKVKQHSKFAGSRLIGQPFGNPVLDAKGQPKKDPKGNVILTPDPRFFQPRPSPTTNYSPSATAFSNLGPDAKATRDAFVANIQAYVDLEKPYTPGLTARRVPVDAATSSASGIDPHISPANARIQARRIAAVRHLPMSRVRKLISDNTDGRGLGLFGEPGVNVIDLNLALGREAKTT